MEKTTFKKLLKETQLNVIVMEHYVNLCCAENEISYYDDEAREFYNELDNIKNAISNLETYLKYNDFHI